MSRRGTNDQQHIMDALDRGDYNYVWEQVKFIGFKKIPSINERYSIYWDIVTQFNTEQNNNFIQYYSSYMGYSANNSRNSRITTTRGVLDRCKREYISPTECKGFPIAADMRNWH
jgi:hypothetical protein